MERAALGERKQGILKAVVNDYIRTAEPVASQILASRYRFGVKSATIRNEMAELSEMGYLRQPHTSAGRIPSDLGYRFYVDWLLDETQLPNSIGALVKKRLTSDTSELEVILEQTCRILSDLARYTSLATDPNIRESIIKHINVAVASSTKLLVVVLLDNGRVMHELMEVRPTTAAIDCVKATNFLNEKIGGQTLSSLRSLEISPQPGDPSGVAELLDSVVSFLKRELESAEQTEVYLGGTNYIFHQPEFKDANRLETVLSLLEERRSLCRIMSLVRGRGGTTVIIGEESPVNSMRDLSFVGAGYRIRSRTAGTIGVFGPTRMDYSRAIAAVEFMAANLSDLLTELSLA